MINWLKSQLKALRQKLDVVLAGAGLALSGVVMAVAFVPPTPALHGNPFDVTMDGVMSGAMDMFNGLWPAFTNIIGIQFGIAILLMVIGIIGGVMLSLSRKKG